MELTTTGLMLIPRAKEAGNITIDVKRIKRLESRIGEVAQVTPFKAPELLATFNKAWLDLNEFVIFLEAEQVFAKQNFNKIKGTLLLDRVPKILQDKGLVTAKSPSGSADLRQAVLETDEEYLAAQDKVYKLDAAISYLKSKRDGFEMAYNSVKKILGETPYGTNSQNALHGNEIKNEIGETNLEDCNLFGIPER